MSTIVKSGVNEMNLSLDGKTVDEVREATQSLLHLDGNEVAKVNGAEVSGGTVVADGDVIEFVKASGEKGAVDIKSGVNSLSLDVAGQTVASVVGDVKTLLHLDGTEVVKVNGVEVDGSTVIADDDVVEFVKASGEKGAVTVTVVSGVNECTITADGDIMDVVTQVKGPLNLEGNEKVTVNGESVNDDYEVQDGDKVEFKKEAGKKGLLV